MKRPAEGEGKMEDGLAIFGAIVAMIIVVGIVLTGISTAVKVNEIHEVVVEQQGERS